MTSDWSSTTKAGCRLMPQAAGARSSRSSQPIDMQDDLGLREGLAQRGFDAIADDVGVAERHRRVERRYGAG